MSRSKLIATIVGARPQFVKVAPVSQALRRYPAIAERIIHTGQHYNEEMSGVFFSDLGIPAPSVNLAVGSLPHGAQTGLMLQRIEEALMEMRPEALLVYGDTNSTLAGALAGDKLHIPVAHVECGLRSHSLDVPEEVNRRVSDHVSTLLFTPTDVATRNLLAEGIPRDRIRQVGDVMLDALRQFSPRAMERSRILDTLGLADGTYMLVTVHRPNHTDDASVRRHIVDELVALASELKIVWPVHPRTRSRMSFDEVQALTTAGVVLSDAVGYLDMLRLELGCRIIVTDSGGVQREAFFVERPCVTLRSNDSNIEWPELVESGWNVFANPADAGAMTRAIRHQLGEQVPRRNDSPFGDGHAAERIAADLHELLATKSGRT